MRRHHRLLATLVALVASVALAGGADAASQKGITVQEGATANANYPPFSGVYPGHQVEEGEPTPAMCNDTGALRAGCDVVPIKIIPPNVSAADDWLVTIRVKWAPDNANTEDLDLFLYDNQQIAKRQDASSTTYTKVGQSSSAANPEIIKVLSPSLGDYNLVVAHFSGISSGYNVQGSISVEKFVSPIEAIDERSASGGGGSADTSDDVVTPQDQGAAPVDFSADAGDIGADIAAITAPTALPEIAILPDADLDAGGGITPTFAAPPSIPNINTLPTTPAKPVPAPVVLFWFLIVPALLVGGGWLVASRRTRTSFSFG